MKQRALPGFGARLAKLRSQRGLSQAALGQAVGVSQRVVAYYEAESMQPPGALIVDLARALKTSTDTLLGVAPVPEERTPRDLIRLRKRLQKVEALPVSDRRYVLKLIQVLYEAQQHRP